MIKKPVSLAAVVFLSLVAIAHLGRLILRLEITADGVAVPMWFSVAGVIAPLLLALGIWRERRV